MKYKYIMISLLIFSILVNMFLFEFLKIARKEVSDYGFQYKNNGDYAFSYITKTSSSFLTLAEVLEELSVIPDDQKQQVRDLIAEAKVLSKQWTDYHYELIRHGANYGGKIEPDTITKDTFSEWEMEDDRLFMINFQVEVWRHLYSLRNRYDESGLIDSFTREYFKETASVIREMDKVRVDYKEFSLRDSFEVRHEGESLKLWYIGHLTEQLETLDDIRKAYEEKLKG